MDHILGSGRGGNRQRESLCTELVEVRLGPQRDKKGAQHREVSATELVERTGL